MKVLQDAQGKFPSDDGIAFELGTVLDKQKKFAEAESAFRQVLSRNPENAIAAQLSGLHARRARRAARRVGVVPDEGPRRSSRRTRSYLDSLGWAYFKADKLDLAETT